MKTSPVPSAVARKTPNFEKLADQIIKSPDLLPGVLQGLDSETPRVKYSCLKLLRIISEKAPALLYPDIDRFFRLQDSDATILKWGAIIVIGNLAVADSERKIDRVLNRYLRPISGHVMITAANVIGGAGKIAEAKPYLADRIANAMLKVEHAQYQTEECRNVALGHAVQAFERFFEHLENKEIVVEFMNRQLSNSRNAVCRKAVKFLKKHGLAHDRASVGSA